MEPVQNRRTEAGPTMNASPTHHHAHPDTTARPTRRSRSLTIRALCGPLLIAGPATAQPATDAPPEPTRIEVRTPAADAPILVREGAFLSDMRGELRNTELGWVMDFAPDAETGDRLNSMILQRGMTLSAMTQIIRAHDESIAFAVSGQVFVYRGRNYLLPTRFAIATDVGQRPANEDAEPAPPVPEPIPGMDDEDDGSSVEDLLERVERAPGQDGDMPVAPQIGAAATLREGQMIAQSRGRVLTDGADLVFTPDSDADSAGGELPPLRLMPCLNLERLEQLRKDWGDRLIVTMSGRVFVTEGQPLLLPTMYVVELDRAGNLSLGQ